jgi:hypothetical protein
MSPMSQFMGEIISSEKKANGKRNEENIPLKKFAATLEEMSGQLEELLAKNKISGDQYNEIARPLRQAKEIAEKFSK